MAGAGAHVRRRPEEGRRRGGELVEEQGTARRRARRGGGHGAEEEGTARRARHGGGGNGTAPRRARYGRRGGHDTARRARRQYDGGQHDGGQPDDVSSVIRSPEARRFLLRGIWPRMAKSRALLPSFRPLVPVRGTNRYQRGIGTGWRHEPVPKGDLWYRLAPRTGTKGLPGPPKIAANTAGPLRSEERRVGKESRL